MLDKIAELEERLAIMQESMETLEQRCEALDALEKRCNALEKRNEPIEPIKPEELWICGACGEGTVGWDDWIIGDTRNNYCPNCGQAVKWERGDSDG